MPDPKTGPGTVPASVSQTGKLLAAQDIGDDCTEESYLSRQE